MVKFLINDWSTNNIHAMAFEDKKLYITVEENAFCVSSNSSKLSMMLCNRLSSEQEEADTKVFLCAKFAFDIGFERVNIVTVDTDVVILGIYFQSMLNRKIYLQYGTSSATTCMTCLKIYWMVVLFKLCLVYMLFVPVIASFSQQKLYLLTKFMSKTK